jgi:SsrA-binding protein
MAKSRTEPDGGSGFKVLASNRKASHDYYILEKLEAGIELRGAEVKSIRAGHLSLNEGYALVENGQLMLYGLHVQPYSHGRLAEQDPDRPKRLLVHKAEVARLVGQTAVKGHTLLPLKVYLTHGLVKVELGLGKGKLTVDKRETLREKTADREARRAMSGRGQ